MEFSHKFVCSFHVLHVFDADGTEEGLSFAAGNFVRYLELETLPHTNFSILVHFSVKVDF